MLTTYPTQDNTTMAREIAPKKGIEINTKGTNKNFKLNEGVAIRNLLKHKKNSVVTDEMIAQFKNKYFSPFNKVKEERTGKSMSIDLTVSKRIDKLAVVMDMTTSDLVNGVLKNFIDSEIDVIKEIINRDNTF